MLRAIAVLKGLQAFTLFGVALAAFQLLRPDVALLVRDWVKQLPIESEQNLIQQAGGWVSSLLPHEVASIGFGMLLYGILFAVECVGLWRRKIWAEWLTVVASGLLIPLEVWEVISRISPLRVLALVLNVAVVWYLVRQLRRNVARHTALHDPMPEAMIEDVVHGAVDRLEHESGQAASR
ncbi:MAG TPA: DUF2127 domain-containing protein [Gemmatimonas sp.]|nr:DUF2127 domain-containing protein [Gemmatimonas sp.]